MFFGVATPPETGHADVDARAFLQRAIELEHATIPPYLAALYSLVPGRNDEIRTLLRSVVTEEMAHMTLAANILSAIGGRPRFTSETFVPTYPGSLPYHIGGRRFHVPLDAFSMELVQNVFMVIEHPEFPELEFPTIPPGPPAEAGADEHIHTVGEFYDRLLHLLNVVGSSAFTGRKKAQLQQPYGAFIIGSLNDAARAIDVIVRQGEGSKQSPLSGRAGELAHYYRFAEIVQGRTLVGDPNTPLHFSYCGRPVPFDADGVIPIVSNAKQAMYPPGSRAARLSRQFNGQYATMLRLLEAAYAGRGGDDVNANIVGLMYDMKILAQRLMGIEIPPATADGARRFAAPTFEMETF